MMNFVQPVTLAAMGLTLEPLALAHEAGLQAAAADGALWNLRIPSVPAPGEGLGGATRSARRLGEVICCCAA